MSLNDKKVFLAGATGLAGNSLIKYLLDNYPHIRIRGNYNKTKPIIRHDNLEYVQANLLNRNDYKGLFNDCDYAILAAASTGGVGVLHFFPERQMTDNIVMDALMLEESHSAGVKRIVYLSSATVYQEYDGYVKEEQLDLNSDPYSAYFGVGWAKRSAEKLCQFWHDRYGMEVIIARCANIYGPFARFDPQYSNFIPALIRKAVDKMDPFEVWGSPSVVRDVIFSDDFAEAVALLLENQDIKFDIFNLGYGETVSVGSVVDAALKAAMHRPLDIKYSVDSLQSIPSRALDCGKLKAIIKWTPRFNLEEGIKETTFWWEKNKATWKK